MHNEPKISCLCVTNNRVSDLKKAVSYFDAQSYQNKELVIVYLSSDTSTKDFLDQIENNLIKRVSVENTEGITLGDLRNISIRESSGSYVCNWDDDDWYHPQRLRIQFDEMRRNGKRASILSYLIMFDNNTKEAYVTHRRFWENSVFCEKKLLEEMSIRYPSMNKEEDTPFVNCLRKAGVIFPIVQAQLYIYRFTGRNTCDSNHFKLLFQYSKKLSPQSSKKISDILSNSIHVNDSVSQLSAPKFLAELVYD